MRHLLLLVAMVAAGQTLPTHIPSSGQPITLDLCQGQKPDAVMFCTTKGPIHYNYRIDWLRPDLYLWPYEGNYTLGTSAHVWGEDGFHSIYISAPRSSVVILLPNGKRVTISRDEIERKAQ